MTPPRLEGISAEMPEAAALLPNRPEKEKEKGWGKVGRWGSVRWLQACGVLVLSNI